MILGTGSSFHEPVHVVLIFQYLSKRRTIVLRHPVCDLQQLIKSPSRESLTTTTVIDHIATTNESNIVTSGAHKAFLSDHYLIYCARKFRGAS